MSAYEDELFATDMKMPDTTDFVETMVIDETLEQMSYPISRAEFIFPELFKSLTPGAISNIKDLEDLATKYINLSLSIFQDLAGIPSDESVTTSNIAIIHSTMNSDRRHEDIIKSICTEIGNLLPHCVYSELNNDIEFIFRETADTPTLHCFMVWPFIARLLNLASQIVYVAFIYPDSFWDRLGYGVPVFIRDAIEKIRGGQYANASSYSVEFRQRILCANAMLANGAKRQYALYTSSARGFVLDSFKRFIDNVNQIYLPVLRGRHLKRSEFSALTVLTNPDLYISFSQQNLKRALSRANRTRKKRPYKRISKSDQDS
jgi:hypothetical protein